VGLDGFLKIVIVSACMLTQCKKTLMIERRGREEEEK
jgi:hypothetical protein